MALSDFHEYLNSKGAMQDKPKVKVVADEVDVPENRKKQPPKGMGMVGDKQPYTKDGKGVAKGNNKGLGDHGDSSLGNHDSKSCKAAKLPTAESFELVHKIRDAIIENPRVLEALANEFNKSNLLGSLVGELVGYKETFQHLAEVMAHKEYGPVVCDRFAKALREDVAPPFGQGGDDFGSGLESDDQMGGLGNDSGMGDAGAGSMGGSDQVTCPHCGGDITDLVMGGDDENAPPDDGMGGGQPGMDGNGPLPPPNPQAKPPMGGAMEHFRHSLKKSFI